MLSYCRSRAGHLGCTDRASELHFIFPTEITWLIRHPNNPLNGPITPYKYENTELHCSPVIDQNINLAFGVHARFTSHVQV